MAFHTIYTLAVFVETERLELESFVILLNFSSFNSFDTDTGQL